MAPSSYFMIFFFRLFVCFFTQTEANYTNHLTQVNKDLHFFYLAAFDVVNVIQNTVILLRDQVHLLSLGYANRNNYPND